MSGPWDVLPVPTLGNPDPQVIYASKGIAVSQWEHVEVALSQLFAVLSGQSRQDLAACQLYGTQMNFHLRLAGMEAVANAYFCQNCHQADEAEWKQIVESCRGAAVRRNEITHSVIRPVQVATAGRSTEYGNARVAQFWVFLVPPGYTDRKFDPSNQPAFIYNSTWIDYFTEQFAELTMEIDMLTSRLDRTEYAPSISTTFWQLEALNKAPPPDAP